MLVHKLNSSPKSARATKSVVFWQLLNYSTGQAQCYKLSCVMPGPAGLWPMAKHNSTDLAATQLTQLYSATKSVVLCLDKLAYGQSPNITQQIWQY